MVSVNGISSFEASRKLLDCRKILKNPLIRGLAPAIERVMAYDELNRLYEESFSHSSERNYFDIALRMLNVTYELSEKDLLRIPKTGAVILVANHPYGGADGIIMGDILARVRHDYKLLVNYLLNAIEPLQPWLISVDPFGGSQAAKNNLRGMKQAFKFLREEHALAIWPSGTVSHLHLSKREVTDPVWNENLAGLIRKTNAMVVPVYFHGRNSNFFQMAGMINPVLRTAMLPRQMVGMSGANIKVSVGKAIDSRKLEKFSDNKELMEFLRLKTYILKDRMGEATGAETRKEPKRFAFGRRVKELTEEALIEPVSEDTLRKEIRALSEESCLVSRGKYAVYVATKGQIPYVLREIGRLREKTFREVGEGTGRSVDLDEFDDYYRHLFMFDHEAGAVVGAYRMGLSDEILGLFGKKGLYTATLFKFKHNLIKRLNPAIELGRSFIQLDYQRKHTSLSMIWKGIGTFVARNPRYRILFGPVSISKDYQKISKDLMVQFLRDKTLHHEFSRFVKAKKPPKVSELNKTEKKRLNLAIKDIEDISSLVSDIETDQRGVPVLLRQYLNLNATMLSFNVDKDFSNVIDGLVFVDLLKTDKTILARYLSEEGVNSLYAYHDKECVQQTA